MTTFKKRESLLEMHEISRTRWIAKEEILQFCSCCWLCWIVVTIIVCFLHQSLPRFSQTLTLSRLSLLMCKSSFRLDLRGYSIIGWVMRYNDMPSLKNLSYINTKKISSESWVYLTNNSTIRMCGSWVDPKQLHVHRSLRPLRPMFLSIIIRPLFIDIMHAKSHNLLILFLCLLILLHIFIIPMSFHPF